MGVRRCSCPSSLSWSLSSASDVQVAAGQRPVQLPNRRSNSGHVGCVRLSSWCGGWPAGRRVRGSCARYASAQVLPDGLGAVALVGDDVVRADPRPPRSDRSTLIAAMTWVKRVQSLTLPPESTNARVRPSRRRRSESWWSVAPRLRPRALKAQARYTTRWLACLLRRSEAGLRKAVGSSG
jgi:hypothetical protein